MAKVKKRNEFRLGIKSHGTRHPTHIFKEEGSDFYFLSITHATKTKGEPNIELNKNPEPGNNSKAYLRPHTFKGKKTQFGKKLDGWKFSEKDNELIKRIKLKEGVKNEKN